MTLYTYVKIKNYLCFHKMMTIRMSMKDKDIF